MIGWHSSPLPGEELTVLDAIPVTTVPRTLLDLAAVVDRRGVERAMNEAEVCRHADRLSLPALLERHPRRREAAKIRAVLAANRVGATVTRSELEERFLRFLSRNRLPGTWRQLDREGRELARDLRALLDP
jgi:hypothetical protein